MDAAIIELNTLSDAVRAAAEDDRLAPIARIGLAFGWYVFAAGAGLAGLVAGIHIGGARFEFGGAGIDALEHRMNAKLVAPRHDRHFRAAGERSQARIAEAGTFQGVQSGTILRQSVFDERLFARHQLLNLGQEPRVEKARAVNLLQCQAGAERLRHHQQAVRPGLAEGRQQRRFLAAWLPALDGR